MLYLLAIVLPPVAVLMSGKPFQAILNVLLTLCFWFPGMLHALFVVHSRDADMRNDKLIKALSPTGAIVGPKQYGFGTLLLLLVLGLVGYSVLRGRQSADPVANFDERPAAPVAPVINKVADEIPIQAVAEEAVVAVPEKSKVAEVAPQPPGFDAVKEGPALYREWAADMRKASVDMDRDAAASKATEDLCVEFNINNYSMLRSVVLDGLAKKWPTSSPEDPAAARSSLAWLNGFVSAHSVQAKPAVQAEKLTDRFTPGEVVWLANSRGSKIVSVMGGKGFVHVKNPTSAQVIRKVPGSSPGQFTMYEVDLTEGEYSGQRVRIGQGAMTRDPKVAPVPDEPVGLKPGGDPRFTVSDAFTKINRPAKDGLPAYTVLYSGAILKGGQHGEVMIPSISRMTKSKDRETMARKIMEKEGFTEISLYSTVHAYKSNISGSYSKEHPGALKNGFLGSLRNGAFSD